MNTNATTRRRATREIRERWFIRGVLELETPAHLSNGDADPSVDMPLVLDPAEGRALLTGASLAGALRHYLNAHQDGYADTGRFAEKEFSPALLLFGMRRGDVKEDDRSDQVIAKKRYQSPLIVEDALGRAPRPLIELRDGVRIDPKTRTAYAEIDPDTGKPRGSKFDMQLLAAGNQFEIGFELVLGAAVYPHREQVLDALAITLHALQTGQISLGGRKHRGYGRCRVNSWRVWRYDLTTGEGVQGWLTHGRAWATDSGQMGDDILSLLDRAQDALPTDQRQRLSMQASFEIDGSLLIRSGFEEAYGPDMVHLSSNRRGSDGKLTPVPVLSGTSLAGVLRHQARRIARTVGRNEKQADVFVNRMFGVMPKHDRGRRKRHASISSRVKVAETAVEGGTRLVQSRVAIDRFTGGALESALFAEEPLFGGQAAIDIILEDPQDAEVGLLLLVLKDLWTGHTPLGGESSVGRGRLRGQTATLRLNDQLWELKAAESGLRVTQGDAAELEAFVCAFAKAMGDEECSA